MPNRTETTRRRYLPRIAIAGMAAAAFATGAAFTAAEAQVNINASPATNYTNSFTLGDMSNATVLSYRHARELRICNMTGRRASDVTQNESAQDFPLVQKSLPMSAAYPVALNVSAHGTTHQIDPGACYYLNARHVRIALAQPLPPHSYVEGTAQWVTPRLG